MEHDFHGEQPVKGEYSVLYMNAVEEKDGLSEGYVRVLTSTGALVYILRRILLDHSDSMATGILRRLAEALPLNDPKARVIIMEEKLLEDPTPQNCIVDLVMLNLGGKLRTETALKQMAAAAGLKVVGFYAREGNPMCVVECARI
jgi:hypothetical protein